MVWTIRRSQSPGPRAGFKLFEPAGPPPARAEPGPALLWPELWPAFYLSSALVIGHESVLCRRPSVRVIQYQSKVQRAHQPVSWLLVGARA
jgi:hypothetical protein